VRRARHDGNLRVGDDVITVADIDALIEQFRRERFESTNGGYSREVRRAYYRVYSRTVSQLESLKAKALEVKA